MRSATNIGEAGERIRRVYKHLRIMEERGARKQEVLSPESTRVIGISARAHSFGFVVIENNTTLDYGVRTCYRSQFDNCLADRFDRILREYDPSAVIILSARSKAAKHRTGLTRNAIKSSARRNRVPTVFVPIRVLNRYFAQYGAATKHEIAAAVAQIMPELAWRLPPKRKPWQNEPYSMAIFHAAAAVIAYTWPR
jgi:hypothetical protein